MTKDLLKQTLLGIVPEEKFIGKGTDELGRLVEPSVMLSIHTDAGFNAARAEMIKNIEQLDLEQLINQTISK